MRFGPEEFDDIPDFILKITERIWEGRGVHRIRDYYAADCIMRTPTVVTRTAEEVVADTLGTLHEFPDRSLLGEDVIWSRNQEGDHMSSHRILSTAHHRGDGRFGAADGRPVRPRCIADCVVRDGRIIEEWLVRDNGSVAKSLGLSARELAARFLELDRRSGRPAAFTRSAECDGPYAGHKSDGAAALGYADTLARLWAEKDLAAVGRSYDRAARLEAPGGQTLFGPEIIDSFYLGYLAAFPDCRFHLEHLIERNDPGRPVRIAARWWACGHHTGFGAFGPPTGRPVDIMGISHAEIVDGRITAEWMLIDEIAVWKQILDADNPG